MPHDRFFIDAPLHMDDHIFLEGDEAHHLHVTRVQIGEGVFLINGRHILAEALLTKWENKKAYLSIKKITNFPPPSPLILAQALPKISRLETIIEKGTELGVTHFLLFPGQKSEKKELKEKDLIRLKNITISSIKQCGRLDLPDITLKPSLDTWSALPTPAFFGDLESSSYPTKEKSLIFIGPESGFSPSEKNHLTSLGATGVKLHHNTLRTDTAAIVALTLLSKGDSYD